jgi:seryl-tRNA(Sec) selenium transferase
VKVEIHYDTEGEWAALYVGGKLARTPRRGAIVGDRHWVEECAFEVLGVTQVQSSAFLRGGDGRADVAETLEEVAAYRAEREARLEEAARLREQAEELRQRAAKLENAAGQQEATLADRRVPR